MQGLAVRITSDVISPKLFRPVSLVLHGNNYLESLKRNNNNDYAKSKLENINVSLKKQGKNENINAKDWLQNLYKNNGTDYISLSRSKSLTAEPEFVLVSSNNNDSNHKAWNINSTFDKNSQASGRVQTTISDSNTNKVQDYLYWRNIALGDVRERFKEALERMRDFAILHQHAMDQIPKSSTQAFLNQLETAEGFIHMDVMLTTKKQLDKLYDFLNLPREYGSTSEARVALQVLNATMCAWMSDHQIIKPFSNNNELNNRFSQLSKELNESLIDSMICSTNKME